MTRRGSALALALIAVGVAVLAAGSLGAAMASSRHAAQQHLQRVQGRELALSALQLPPGTCVSVAGWTVRRDATGAEAQGPAGCWRIDSEGREKWRRP